MDEKREKRLGVIYYCIMIAFAVLLGVIVPEIGLFGTIGASFFFATLVAWFLLSREEKREAKEKEEAEK